MKPTHRPLVAGVALAAALGLGACGSGTTTSATTTGSSASAAEQPAAAGKVGDEVPLGELAGRLSAALEKAGSAKVVMGDDKDQLKGEISSKPGALAYTMNGKISGGQADMIYVDKVLYMSGGSFGSAAGGKKWVKLDPNGTDSASKMLAPLFKLFELAANPGALFTDMNDVKAKVVKVEGDLTTYEATINGAQMDRLAKKVLGADAAPSSPSRTSSTKSETMTWVVNSKDQAVKVTLDKTGKQSMTYSDYGAPVSISAPPASEVGTLEMPSFPTPSSS